MGGWSRQDTAQFEQEKKLGAATQLGPWGGRGPAQQGNLPASPLQRSGSKSQATGHPRPAFPPLQMGPHWPDPAALSLGSSSLCLPELLVSEGQPSPPPHRAQIHAARGMEVQPRDITVILSPGFRPKHLIKILHSGLFHCVLHLNCLSNDIYCIMMVLFIHSRVFLVSSSDCCPLKAYTIAVSCTSLAMPLSRCLGRYPL